MRLQALHKLPEFSKTAVFTVWNTCRRKSGTYVHDQNVSAHYDILYTVTGPAVLGRSVERLARVFLCDHPVGKNATT